MKFLLSLFTLILTLSSCDSSKKNIEASKKMQATPSGTYYITHIANTDVTTNKLVITFDEASNKVTGFANCNSFFGHYSINNNTIHFENIATSKKLCPKDIMQIERQFLKSLKAVNSFSITNNSISFSENNNILLTGTNTRAISKKSHNTEESYKTAVKYQALSRGSYDFILISKHNISISKDAKLQKIENYEIENSQWKALKTLIEAVDVETLKDLKAPSTAHQYDGAPHATLAIQIGDTEYTTPAFDHGNPPETIEALVNKVLSIKENIVKP